MHKCQFSSRRDVLSLIWLHPHPVALGSPQYGIILPMKQVLKDLWSAYSRLTSKFRDIILPRNVNKSPKAGVISHASTFGKLLRLVSISIHRDPKVPRVPAPTSHFPGFCRQGCQIVQGIRGVGSFGHRRVALLIPVATRVKRNRRCIIRK